MGKWISILLMILILSNDLGFIIEMIPLGNQIFGKIILIYVMAYLSN